MFDKLFMIFLGLFLLLFGLAAVTNIQIEWMTPITGLAALIAGAIALVRVFR